MEFIKFIQNRYREPLILLKQLVITDFKLRYRGSVLGYAWSVLKPLFMFLILYLVFAVVLKAGKDIPNYPIYLLLGIVLWSFFSETTTQGLSSIVSRGDLIRKISIPKWLIIISASIGALISLGLNFIIVLIFAIVYGVDYAQSILLLPIFVFEIYIFALGIAFILSALFVRYRDISYIWDVVIQAGFYITPILYSLSLISNAKIQQIMLLNPMAQAIQGARSVAVTTETITISEVFASSFAVVIPLLIVFFTFMFGVIYFRNRSKAFAENL